MFLLGFICDISASKKSVLVYLRGFTYHCQLLRNFWNDTMRRKSWSR
jgi:hypothetical protein